MKIVFFIASLGQGGAERVVNTLSNHFVLRHEVVIVTLSRHISDFYDINPNIKRMYILDNFHYEYSFAKNIIQLLYTIKQMYRILKVNQPDLTISFINKLNVLCIIAAKLSKTPVIVSERSNPFRDIKGTFDFLRKFLYSFSDAVVFQTKGAASYFNKKIQDKSVIINNPLPCVALDNVQDKKDIIVAMGRLEPVKNFELLIESVYLVRNSLRAADWSVYLFGEGSQKTRLIGLVKEYELDDLVIFKGQTKDPFKCFGSAKVFVLTSRYEGFPNVLCEAMVNGCVPVSVNCDFGPAEIIDDNVNGFLTGSDPVEISKRLVSLVEDSVRLKKMQKQCLTIQKNFEISVVSNLWEETFNRITR